MKPRHRMPLVISCLATFLLLAYTTIVTVAIPAVAEGLHTDFAALQWVVDVYTLALAALLVVAGAVGDVMGRRRVFVGGFVLFTLSSLACGLAPDVVALTVFRGAQGVGGAAMFATTLPLIRASYSGREQQRAFAVWGAVAGLAAAVGNVSGGLLAEALGWRSIFLLAVVPGALGVSLAVRFLARDPERDARRVDIAGAVLLGVGLAALVVAALLFGEHGAGPGPSVAALVACACGVGFVVCERRAPDPLVDLALFRHPRFLAVVAVAFGYYFAAFGPLTVLSSWFQDAAGLGAVRTALLLSVQPVVFFAVSALCGAALQRAPLWLPLGIGTALCAVGCLSFLLLGLVYGPAALVPSLVLTGVGAGMVSPVLASAAMRDADPSRAGVASAVANTARQVGLAVGVAVCGGLFVGLADPGRAAYTRTLGEVAAVAASVGLATAALAVVLLRRQRVRARTAEAGAAVLAEAAGPLSAGSARTAGSAGSAGGAGTAASSEFGGATGMEEMDRTDGMDGTDGTE
ncbi:MFS transporter [Streptomyces sp. NPDC014744]|uniref:MFS transporter n=1 Tax=Streptomyces sp. NPDC014744 TaxID=3364903 RepID=UPI0036F52FE8